MRICIITSSFPRHSSDPAGIFIYHLAKWLRKKDLDIDIVAPHHKGCKFYEKTDGVNIYRFPYFFPLGLQKLSYGSGIVKNINQHPPTSSLIPFFLLSEILYTLFVAKRSKTDIIHAHWTMPQGFSGVFCKKLIDIPLVTTVHGSDIFNSSSSALNHINKWIFQNCDAITVNSNATQKAVKDRSSQKNISIIPMGVDTTFFKPTDDNPSCLKVKDSISDKVILYVGRLIDWKGVAFLIRSMPQVLVKYPNAKLLIVGDGPERQRLEKLSWELKVNSSLVFTGSLSQEEIRNYHSMADVFVLPSIVNENGETEGLGVVLLEAMACGVPVIGSSVGGIGDIVKHETTGLLMPPKDPGAIAECVIRFFEDEKLRTGLIDNGRRFVEERFSWDVISDQFIQLYKAIQNTSHRL